MRVALIVRGDEGDSLEIARQVGARGAAVLLGCKNAQRGAEAAAMLRGEGLNAVAIPLDEMRPESIARAALKIDADFGRLDLLVNTAAGAIWDGMQALLSKSDIGRVVNLRDDSTDQILRLDLDSFGLLP